MSIGVLNVMCLGCDLFDIVMAPNVAIAALLGNWNWEGCLGDQMLNM